MERYSASQSRDDSPADPVSEWVTPGGETGLEEPMWQLGLADGPESYPERPDEADCMYYLRTGFCGYGARCRFNHPRDRSAAMGAFKDSGIQYPERVGQPVCQYYMRTGTCKFGSSCKYHHPKDGGSSSVAAFNIYGYPLRPGEKECSYYVKTGQCKYGATCKFHHPQPTSPQVPVRALGPGPLAAATAFHPPAIYPPMQSPLQSSQLVSGNWPVARPAMFPGSYIPGTYSPMLLAPGVVPLPGWAANPASINPAASASTETAIGGGPVYGLSQLSASATAYTGSFLPISTPPRPSSSSQKEHAFPERPGQPECQHYLRTGDCKFGSSCKYHHPPEWSGPRTNFALSPMGLPLRPGVPLCSNYALNGVCKFGPSCKFDHPMRTLSYSPSASSLTDMPVAPYPVGSTNATLAPSSSSSDLRPELSSGLSTDAISTQMSSMNSSSASVGSIFSKGGPAPQSSVQQSAEASTSSSSSSTGHAGEIDTFGAQ